MGVIGSTIGLGLVGSAAGLFESTAGLGLPGSIVVVLGPVPGPEPVRLPVQAAAMSPSGKQATSVRPRTSVPKWRRWFDTVELLAIATHRSEWPRGLHCRPRRKPRVLWRD